MPEIDLINRDPNGINDYLRCQFEDVLAEPEGIRSLDCVWQLSYTCFECWKSCCYRFCTLFCGVCIAMVHGCEFAGLMFGHIWLITPGLRVCAICCTPLQKCWGICCNCCMGPISEAFGMLLSNIKITMVKS